MKASESAHNLCTEINLLYSFNPNLDEERRIKWIHDGLRQLAKKSEPMAHECMVNAANLITQNNLKNYEIIRLDQLKEDEQSLRENNGH